MKNLTFTQIDRRLELFPFYLEYFIDLKVQAARQGITFAEQIKRWQYCSDLEYYHYLPLSFDDWLDRYFFHEYLTPITFESICAARINIKPGTPLGKIIIAGIPDTTEARSYYDMWGENFENKRSRFFIPASRAFPDYSESDDWIYQLWPDKRNTSTNE